MSSYDTYNEYVSIVDNPYVNLEGFDKSNCCHSLQLNRLGHWYCEKYHEGLGYDKDGALKAMMYCQFYYSTYRCWIDLNKEAQQKKAEEERAEKEKKDAEEKALFEGLIETFSRQIQLNPNDAKNYSSRGGAYFQLKDFKKALSDYNEAIRLNPNDAEAYAFRGFAHCQRDDGHADNNLGIADLNEAIRINSDCKNAYWFRASIYGVQGEHDKSISDYEEVLRIEPDDSTTKSLLENAKRLKEEAERKHKEKIKQRFWNKFKMALGGIIGGLAFGFFSSVAYATLFRVIFTIVMFIIAFRHKSNNFNDGFLWFLGYTAISIIAAIGIIALLTNLPQILCIIIGVIVGGLIGRFILKIKSEFFG